MSVQVDDLLDVEQAQMVDEVPDAQLGSALPGFMSASGPAVTTSSILRSKGASM